MSPRLTLILEALPIATGIRVLEIGCGPGVFARAIAQRIDSGHVLAIDRSSRAIAQAVKGSQREIEAGRLRFRQVAIEDFEREPGEPPYDLAVAIRVGALDGRHPELETQAHRRLAAALTAKGRLYIDGGESIAGGQVSTVVGAQGTDKRLLNRSRDAAPVFLTCIPSSKSN